MRTGVLRGRDHTWVGAVATLAERGAAIALSRGGAEKTYEYRDPNEDVCAFALTPHAWLAVVADGHWGHGGAERTVGRILERHAPRWTASTTWTLEERWRQDAPDVLLDLHRALIAAGPSDPRGTIGRTTLALCLVRPHEGWWAGLCIGDSHLFRVDRAGPSEPCPAQEGEVAYLGDVRLDRAQLARCARTTVQRSGSEGAIVLATDGLSEARIGVSDPLAVVAEAVASARAEGADLRPLAAARGVAERALEAQRRNAAGDNIATACLWLEGS